MIGVAVENKFLNNSKTWWRNSGEFRVILQKTGSARTENLWLFEKRLAGQFDGQLCCSDYVGTWHSVLHGVHGMPQGFSVEGQENIQEILSKRLYLCQFLCALMVLRPGGNFMCKLFDLFTPFSVGLVYLIYRAFNNVAIYKPVTSRPANSERYFWFIFRFLALLSCQTVKKCCHWAVPLEVVLAKPSLVWANVCHLQNIEIVDDDVG